MAEQLFISLSSGKIADILYTETPAFSQITKNQYCMLMQKKYIHHQGLEPHEEDHLKELASKTALFTIAILKVRLIRTEKVNEPKNVFNIQQQDWIKIMSEIGILTLKIKKNFQRITMKNAYEIYYNSI